MPNAASHPVEAHAVQSSLLASVGYHHHLGLLDVVLTNGYRYRYFDVPRHIYTGLLEADSKGRFFNAQIKGVFGYQRF